MDERDQAQERARRRVWTVAVRVGDGALRALVVGQLHASAETELAAEAGWNAADVSVTDDAALAQTLERATVLLTDDISLAHAALADGVAAVLPTDVSRGVLVAAIAAAARGLSVLEPGLLSRVVHDSAWPFHEKGLINRATFVGTDRPRARSAYALSRRRLK